MKRHLLAVCGCTPQVITETLFALYQQQRMIDSIRIITTSVGKKAIYGHLLSPDDGYYYQFLKDYNVDPETIDFKHHHVKAVADENGSVLNDIECEEDNEYFLRECMNLSFMLTKEANSAVYFSIAGGRKTMGACLALAAQFYARPQDRIYHVLVSREFENCKEFFYPPPKSTKLRLRDMNGETFYKETKYARVNLISMPFVSVRDRLAEDMLKGPEEPASLLMSLIRDDRHELTVDLKDSKLSWKGVELDLSPAHAALYGFFAKLKRDADCIQDKCRDCRDCFLEFSEIENHQQELGKIYDRLAQKNQRDTSPNSSGIANLDASSFNSHKSKLKTLLENRFGPYERPLLEIASVGERPNTRYGLIMDRGRIRLIY